MASRPSLAGRYTSLDPISQAGIGTQLRGQSGSLFGRHFGTLFCRHRQFLDRLCQMRGFYGASVLLAAIFRGHTAPHAAAAEGHRYRDGAFDASAEALGLLEGWTFLQAFTLWSFLAAALRDARTGNASFAAGLLIGGIMKAAVGGIRFGNRTEHVLVVFERCPHMSFDGRISVQDAILRAQALSAFGQEDFVTGLDRFIRLATFDQIRVGFEDRVDFSEVGTCSPSMCCFHGRAA